MLCKLEKKKKSYTVKTSSAIDIHHGQEANSNVRKYRTEYVQNHLCHFGNAYQNMEKLYICVTKNKVRRACTRFCVERGI